MNIRSPLQKTWNEIDRREGWVEPTQRHEAHYMDCEKVSEATIAAVRHLLTWPNTLETREFSPGKSEYAIKM
jgi:hypothetical protein